MQVARAPLHVRYQTLGRNGAPLHVTYFTCHRRSRAQACIFPDSSWEAARPPKLGKASVGDSDTYLLSLVNVQGYLERNLILKSVERIADWLDIDVMGLVRAPKAEHRSR